MYANAEINTLPTPGRFVPLDGLSHAEVQVKAEAASDFSSPVATFFTVYGYESGATATDPTGSSEPADSAPTDDGGAGFTTVDFPL